MPSRRTVLGWVLLASPLLLPGCGDYTNDNVPELVVTPEMMQEAADKEAQRLERYRRIAAEKGLAAPQRTNADPSLGAGFDKVQAAAEKRQAAAAKRAEQKAAGKK